YANTKHNAALGRKASVRFDIAIMSTKGVSVTAHRQLTEHTCDAFGDGAIEFIEPPSVTAERRFVARLEISRNEVVLGAEVVVQCPLGDAGFFGNRVDAHATDTLPVEEFIGSLKNSIARVHRKRAPLGVDNPHAAVSIHSSVYMAVAVAGDLETRS